MTNATKLSTDIINVTAAPVASAVAETLPKKPYSIKVFGPTQLAMQELAAHVRNGYVPDIHTAIEVFAHAGTISIVLVLGNPEQEFLNRAAVTIADEQAQEEMRFKRAVELAAERQLAAKAKAENEARRAALIAEQRAVLAKLEADFLTAPRELLASLEKEAAVITK